MIQVGDIVRTSYNTGPYRVVEVSTGCTCPEYITSLDYLPGKAPASPPHFHLVCVKGDCPVGKEPRKGDTWAGYSWLNGYVERDGRYVCVWRSKDEIFVEGHASGAQLNLFA